MDIIFININAGQIRNKRDSTKSLYYLRKKKKKETCLTWRLGELQGIGCKDIEK